MTRKQLHRLDCPDSQEQRDKRILIVDEDVEMQAILRDLLEEEGYEVDTTSDELQAHELLAQHFDYRLILLNVHILHQKGLQFLSHLQEDPDVSWPPIMAYSGDRHVLERAVGIGACCSLCKPFDLEDVLSRVLTCAKLPLTGGRDAL